MSTPMQTQYAAGDAVADSSEEPLSVYISRAFRAPRQRIFDAWIKPEMLLKWRGPGWGGGLGASSDRTRGGLNRVGARGWLLSQPPDDKPVDVTAASWGV